ncbi:bifunctional UDP-N-acetylglucosamine pyrophosphorylase / Glucosamine-1-phosphate N-acetyltransferase [Hathewaya proteolytica DSM 3090]|uniref:Bifunctional protein GlmU n=1 Tax=Hathewaya proteolytica DSM 3090 TaxID=1121331 RepID=A0A1M6MAK0_9CLOT|nr:bifunctional UDP-N-acetylglucosamine diphosphorylase/glucosamine-1-phosphate N-acetyltransferase GlmU [Hathewaya proteolytica]SHJ80461.1 bifunctional UDP-N-acetylglucosamine pyrophosphorylase / Glucosamine-1-phosphate N-acetyltransferase [Hathewaya proteolytica DSM 3090]
MKRSVVVLAAGQGTRMKSSLHKVLHKICGKEMINHVIDTIRESGIEDINLVVGKDAERVMENTADRNISYSVQKEQLGTGHAVICANDFLNDMQGNVAVFVGDAPLITVQMVQELFKFHEEGHYAATVITSVVEDAKKYGRIIRDSKGHVEKIVEFKDCSCEELQVKEINSGMYCFKTESLQEALKELKNDNAQGEYYLTDVISILKDKSNKIGAFQVHIEDITAVNSREELSDAELIMRKRINKTHMSNGVTLIDPNNTYIQWDVKIGKDTIIYPNNVIEGATVIGENCTIYPGCRIDNSDISNETIIQSSVIINSRIGKNATVGPFAYIRPESSIGDNTRIGDFVEIKKSTIGNGTKVSHLTYIGDAEVGEKCNFGCGTVIVNYDGQFKNKTTIGDNVFIGCNSNIISPVELKDNSYIAAGSTITEEVPEGNLAIARTRQTNKAGWVEKKGLKK